MHPDIEPSVARAEWRASAAAGECADDTLRTDRVTVDRGYSKVTRRIVPLLLLGYVIAYLDRVNVSFAKLQMLDDLALSETVYGLGAGIFFLGYFLFEVPSNLLLHRLGARVWLSRIMISWGLISAAMMFVSTPVTFYVFRFLLGVAEAGFFPGVIYYLTLWYPASRRARVTAMFMTGIAISSVAGGLLSGWLMQTFDGVNGWAGWQWMFVLEALPAVALGCYLYFRLDGDIQSATWLTREEKSMLVAELARDVGSSQEGSFKDAFLDRRVWLACVIYFCAMTGLYGIGFWLPTIILDLGIESPSRIGALTAIPYAVAGIGMVLVGRSADRRGERRWHIAVPATLGALGLLLSTELSHTPTMALAALTLAAFGILTVPPLFWSLTTTYFRGAWAAAGIAMINSFGNLAGFVSPYAVGSMKDVSGSTDGGMHLIAALVFLVGVLVLLAVPRRREP